MKKGAIGRDLFWTDEVVNRRHLELAQSDPALLNQSASDALWHRQACSVQLIHDSQAGGQAGRGDRIRWHQVTGAAAEGRLRGRLRFVSRALSVNRLGHHVGQRLFGRVQVGSPRFGQDRETPQARDCFECRMLRFVSN